MLEAFNPQLPKRLVFRRVVLKTPYGKQFMRVFEKLSVDLLVDQLGGKLLPTSCRSVELFIQKAEAWAVQGFSVTWEQILMLMPSKLPTAS